MSESDRQKWNERYREGACADRAHPSALLEEWIDLVPVGRALDVACGTGRNTLYLALRGFSVDAVDISAEALAKARDAARHSGLSANWLVHDFDQPLELPGLYQLIVNIRYVNLALVRRLSAKLAPGGYLICEQHLASEADVIGPKNPAYRVRPGELPEAAEGLHIIHHQEGLVQYTDGRTAALARLVARRD
jgi:SAM-dependent methyltransferase